MKRVFTIILALFYLAITSGVIVNMHYCMGELASVDYGHQQEEQCGKCGMPDGDNACCHTDTTLVKLQQDHQLSSIVLAFAQPAIMPVHIAWVSAHSAAAPSPLPQYAAHAPPGAGAPSVHILHCVFRV